MTKKSVHIPVHKPDTKLISGGATRVTFAFLVSLVVLSIAFSGVLIGTASAEEPIDAERTIEDIEQGEVTAEAGDILEINVEVVIQENSEENFGIDEGDFEPEFESTSIGDTEYNGEEFDDTITGSSPEALFVNIDSDAEDLDTGVGPKGEFEAGDTISQQYFVEIPGDAAAGTEFNIRAGDGGGVGLGTDEVDPTGPDTIVIEGDPPSYQLSSLDPADETITEGDAPIDISADVENEGEETGNQDIELIVEDEEGDEVLTDTEEDVELPSGEIETVTFTDIDIGDLSPGEYTHTIVSDDDSISGDLTVQSQPHFEVTINEETLPNQVVEGEEITIDYFIENTGDITGEQDVIFNVNGEQEDIESDVELEGDEEFSDSFTYETEEGQSTEITVEIATDDDEESAEITILEEGALSVDNFNAPDEAEQGQEVTASADIVHSGDIELAQDVIFSVDGVQEDSKEVMLDTGQENIEFTYTVPEDEEAESIEVEIATDDDEESAEVTILEVGEFIVDIDDEASELDVDAGEMANIEVDIENTGEAELTQDVIVDINDQELDRESDVTLGSEGEDTITLSFEAEVGFDGEEITVSSEDDSDQAELAVAGFGVNIDTEVSDLDVDEDETITVVVNIENTDETELTQDITAEVNDQVQDTIESVTLDEGETDEVTLSFEAESGFDGQDITISSEDDISQVELTVDELDDSSGDETSDSIGVILMFAGIIAIAATGVALASAGSE